MLLTGFSEIASGLHDVALSGEVSWISFGEVGVLSICLIDQFTKRFVIFACSVVIAAGAGEVISPILGGLAYEEKLERCVQAAKVNGFTADVNSLRSCNKWFYYQQI